MEGTLHKGHEDHIAGKGMNSMNHYNLVHIFRSESTGCKCSSGKRMGQTRENSSVASDESQKQERRDR